MQTKPTKTLQLLNDAISECDLDEDSDLCEYFGDGEEIVPEPVDEEEEEDEEEEDEEEEEKPIPRFESDHCYFSRVDNLGIDTPSDSGKSSFLIHKRNESHTIISITMSLL